VQKAEAERLKGGRTSWYIGIGFSSGPTGSGFSFNFDYNGTAALRLTIGTDGQIALRPSVFNVDLYSVLPVGPSQPSLVDERLTFFEEWERFAASGYFADERSSSSCTFGDPGPGGAPSISVCSNDIRTSSGKSCEMDARRTALEEVGGNTGSR
jgi:hypothetical protein